MTNAEKQLLTQEAYRVLEEIDSILAPYAECGFRPPFYEDMDVLQDLAEIHKLTKHFN